MSQVRVCGVFVLYLVMVLIVVARAKAENKEQEVPSPVPIRVRNLREAAKSERIERSPSSSEVSPFAEADAKEIQEKADEERRDKRERLQKQMEQDRLAAEQQARKAYLNKMKRTRKYKSYLDAEQFLAPILWHDGMAYEGVSIFLTPMRTKGKVMSVAMKVLQILDRDTLLLVTPRKYVVEGELPNQVYFGRINKNFTGTKDFSPDQCYSVIEEVVGTKRYTDVRGFAKTVPEVFIYAIGTEGIDESQSRCY